MAQATPHIGADIPKIRQLNEAAINRIAAGEVVERPASAVKELVENAIDAGSSRIVIDVANGGKSLIRISDDGHGIAAADLPLALTRHATSKTDGADLLDIHSFGFRGEALPSLAAVGRFTITSRAAGAEAAASLAVSAGQSAGVKPAALTAGTIVELRDIFYATPARLKFMRSDRAEMMAITEVVKRLAMAEPSTTFILNDVTDGGLKQVFRADAAQGELFDAVMMRLGTVLGREFVDNSMRIDTTREDIRLWGAASLPTYSRGAAVSQYLFVNGRPVRDKLLVGALRGGYADVLARDRHPVVALFVDCPTRLVDMNVHPAKTEVRFRDPALVRGLIVSALRHALLAEGHRSSGTVATGILSHATPEIAPDSARIYQMPLAHADRPMRGFAEPTARVFEPATPVAEPTSPTPEADLPLGAARAQLHENYIIAQTPDGLVIVDQHAAHERLVYERLKAQFDAADVRAQALLIPEIVELEEATASLVLDAADDLARLGLVVEPFGGGAVAVRETPALLGQVNAAALIRDIADELLDNGGNLTLRGRIDAVLSRVSCHGSVRSGRQMRADEMNALLREMEATPSSGQCNHGRPTYVKLKLADIERLFGRS